MRAMRVLTALSMSMGAALWMAACGDGGTGDGGTTVPPPTANRAPTAVGSLGALTIEVGAEATVNVASNFSDADGDALTYTASTSAAAVATAAVSGGTVAVTGVGVGTATITVTATDPGGLSATQTMGVTVEAPNQPPTVVGGLDDQTVSVGDTITADVGEYFEDPDGDELTFSAASSDTAVATAAVDGPALTVVAIAEGGATVTVTATDPGGLSATQTMGVTVEAPNQPPTVVGGLDDQTVSVGDTITADVGEYFEDPDGDELTFSAASSDTAVATAAVDGPALTVVAIAEGGATVTVTATDAADNSSATQFTLTVEAPNRAPEIADTIPTHDMIVDSMVPLDMSPYFEGGELTYTVMSSDEMVAVSSVDGSTMTTTGTGAVEDSISTAFLTVTATDASGESVTQDSIMVRVHQEEYDTLPGISIDEEGNFTAVFGGTTVTLEICLNVTNFPVAGELVTVFWSEWQRAAGGGWITAQNNVRTTTTGNVNICPIRLAEDQHPPGIYRLVGHVKFGDEMDFYTTPTVEKKPPAS